MVEISAIGNCTELFTYQITVCVSLTIQANHMPRSECYRIKSYGSATLHSNHIGFTKPWSITTTKKIVKYFCTCVKITDFPTNVKFLEVIHPWYVLYAWYINPLNAELNPICHLLALLGAHHILHVSRIRVKKHSLSWFQTFAVFWILYVFFWVFPWHPIVVCRRVRTPAKYPKEYIQKTQSYTTHIQVF